MSNLEFSEPIILAYNQSMSVVVDDLEKKKTKDEIEEIVEQTGEEPEQIPKIGNYGLIATGQEVEISGNSSTGSSQLPITRKLYNLKTHIVDLDENRDFKAALNNTIPIEAKDLLETDCGEDLPNKIGFTVKSFPHFGVYGYINYNVGDNSSFQHGILLNVSRELGDIF